MDSETVVVDVISDIMCPWCFIGMKRLDEARAIAQVPVTVRWRPFQLDPTLPREGKDRARYLTDKFGGEPRVEAILERISEAGHAAGIDFAFDRIKLSPNTLDCHRLIRWAFHDDAQEKLVSALFHAYFTEGADLTDHATLAAIAGDCGMDASLVAHLLATDTDVAATKAEIAAAQQIGVTGVPCFIVNGKYAVMGAQRSQDLADIIAKAADEAKAEAEAEAQTLAQAQAQAQAQIPQPSVAL
ncbi:DsbA family oxidoreductase [Breoghania sp.]|uniref:DsbA family oxidoreductase n=1 Tax=Breoghania sp. TaxID=2065378 RepID=UPI002AA65FB4|nr:DsbA family oxidoreductase [Breoghania sp.]